MLPCCRTGPPTATKRSPCHLTHILAQQATEWSAAQPFPHQTGRHVRWHDWCPCWRRRSGESDASASLITSFRFCESGALRNLFGWPSACNSDALKSWISFRAASLRASAASSGDVRGFAGARAPPPPRVLSRCACALSLPFSRRLATQTPTPASISRSSRADLRILTDLEGRTGFFFSNSPHVTPLGVQGAQVAFVLFLSVFNALDFGLQALLNSLLGRFSLRCEP